MSMSGRVLPMWPASKHSISGRTPAVFMASRKSWMSLNEFANTWSW